MIYWRLAGHWVDVAGKRQYLWELIDVSGKDEIAAPDAKTEAGEAKANIENRAPVKV